jgi:ankyrin repeat protein
MHVSSKSSDAKEVLEIELGIQKVNKVLRRYGEAVEKKDKTKIKELLEVDSDLLGYRFPDNNYKTAFHIAAKDGDRDFFDFLFSFEPNGIFFVDYRNKTPLFFSLRNSDETFVSHLIDIGSSLDQLELKNSTPLYSCVSNGKTKILKLLLERGANVNIQNKLGRTPLIKASFLISILIKEKEGRFAFEPTRHRYQSHRYQQ